MIVHTYFSQAVLFTLNVIFFLAGALVAGVGLWVRFDPQLKSYATAVGISLTTGQLYIAAYVLIAFGGFTFIAGFCGCCGAIRESKVC